MNCQDCYQTCHARHRSRRWKCWSFWSHKRPKTNFPREETKMALVGSPNVGKSLLFNLLTGTNITVYKYPSTTVEVAQGTAIIAGEKVTFFDTPAMSSLTPITEEESVARDLIMKQKMNLVIHVVEAKHLGKMLNLTRQLIEAHFPVLLVVNMSDKTKKLGIYLDEGKLIEKLEIPVVIMSATQKTGLKKLTAKVANYVQATPLVMTE